MDVPTINSTMKTPMKRPEADQHGSPPQESDPAFVQLLAGLGLIAPIPPQPVNPETPPTLNGGLSHGIEEAVLVSQTGALSTTEQKNTAGAKTQAGNVLLAESIQTFVKGPSGNDGVVPEGDHDSDPTGLAAAQRAAIPTAQGVKVQWPIAVTSRPDLTGAAQDAGHGPIAGTVPQAVLGKLVDGRSSGAGSKEDGASAVISISMASIPNAALEPPAAPDASIKQTSTPAQSLIWNAVMESSTLPESGEDNNSASSDHHGGKERLPHVEGNGSQAAPAPATSSFSAPSAPMPTKAAAGVETPSVTGPLESPLSASVRFEVQQGDMGRIRVHLSVVDHTVYTNVMTERIEAHDFLVKGSDRYEAGLAAHGLDVGRFQVDVQGHSREQGDRGGTGWSQEQTSRQRAGSPNAEAMEWHAEERKVEWDNRMVNVFA